ncbi:MAG: phosphoribosylamine--glycine ligase [Chloroflexi bacterium]|nr:MAG: phosphoribosylamine--glycine ligase [Chloroflexota bacterium]
MNLLIVGSGAREHALAWKLRQSPKLTDLFIAPGNGGTAAIATNLPADLADLEAICTAATHHRIDLVIVGQEGPIAAGLVVFVCDTTDEALRAVDLMLGDERIFGPAGSTVIVEERLSGREVSAHAFTDGLAVAPMPFSCDYKRAYDGDDGPNTGGMGAYSPPLWLDEPLEPLIHETITEAAVQAMREEGAPYRGVLYPGLMITPEGPRVLEFNCRFGDPETQVLLPRLKSDLLEICWAVANNRLSEAEIEWSTDACVGVVIASGGYPGQYETGFPIAGLNSVEPGVFVFHAGTTRDEDDTVRTSGGRVLTVVASAATLQEARAIAYRNVQRIHFSRAQYRRDIAAPAQDARVD